MIKSRESRQIRDPLRRKNFRTPLLAAGFCLLASCSTPHAKGEPWVYGISRNVYPSLCVDGELFSSLAQDSRTECAALAILVVYALPFAIDTVLLPVTVPHDLIVAK